MDAHNLSFSWHSSENDSMTFLIDSFVHILWWALCWSYSGQEWSAPITILCDQARFHGNGEWSWSQHFPWWRNCTKGKPQLMNYIVATTYKFDYQYLFYCSLNSMIAQCHQKIRFARFSCYCENLLICTAACNLWKNAECYNYHIIIVDYHW